MHCLVKYFLISDCIEDSFEFLFQFAILSARLLTSAHQKWPSIVVFERMRGDPDLAASWKAHPLDFIQTNRLNKKAPSGGKKNLGQSVVVPGRTGDFICGDYTNVWIQYVNTNSIVQSFTSGSIRI